jgi:hypothetical protein
VESNFAAAARSAIRFDADDVAALGGKNGVQAHARLRQGRLRTDFMVRSEGCLSRQKMQLLERIRISGWRGVFTKLEYLILNQLRTAQPAF